MGTAATTNLPSSFPSHIVKTSIGKKIIMAVSGFMAFGFVVGHMLGNLQVFMGQDQLNMYAEKLQSLGPILWVIRLVMLTAIGLHIWFGIKLKLENWAARPESYRNETTVQASFASRTMIWTGIVIASFVVYHLLHYTVRVTNPEYANLVDPLGRTDVYSMVIMGFSNYLVSGFYIVAVGLLAYHLSHGIASMFQSLGLNTPEWQKRLKCLGWLATIFLFVGYAAVPLGVILKIVILPEGGM